MRAKRVALLVMLVAWIGGLIAVLQRQEGNRSKEPMLSGGDQRSPVPSACEEANGGRRVVYSLSVVPGGLCSDAEAITAAERDSVVRNHYSGIQLHNLRLAKAPGSLSGYLSYRRGDKVYWTKTARTIPEGEALLVSGQEKLRARCGNRISDTKRMPVGESEPTDEELSMYSDPSAGSATGTSEHQAELTTGDGDAEEARAGATGSGSNRASAQPAETKPGGPSWESVVGFTGNRSARDGGSQSAAAPDLPLATLPDSPAGDRRESSGSDAGSIGSPGALAETGGNAVAAQPGYTPPGYSPPHAGVQEAVERPIAPDYRFSPPSQGSPSAEFPTPPNWPPRIPPPQPREDMYRGNACAMSGVSCDQVPPGKRPPNEEPDVVVTPEPSALALIATGAAILVALRRFCAPGSDKRRDRQSAIGPR